MDEIKEINSDDCYYENNYVKIKFNSNHDLPLKKSLKFHLMNITIRSVFEEDGKLYPQVFLDDTLYELSIWKMLEYERIDISDGIDINKINQSKECMLCHYWYFLDKIFSYGPYLWDGCYNIMQKYIKLKNIPIIYIKKSTHRIYFLYMSMREAKEIMNNSNLIDKKGVLKK